MPRTRGYAAKGERCYGVHDWNAKGRTNAIGAIAHFVFLTLGLFESTIRPLSKPSHPTQNYEYLQSS